MHDHFIERCSNCDTVISQCRCMGDKETKYSVCDKCKQEIEDFTHNSKTAGSEASWSSVMKNRSKLPDMAFADRANRAYPHHAVVGGSGENDEGRWTSGRLVLSRSGLSAAYSASQGSRSGQKASSAVIAHLNTHRKAIGMGEDDD